jgi:hypothetical protein
MFGLGQTPTQDVEKAFAGMLLITAGFFVYYYESVIYERYFDPQQRIAIDVPRETPPPGFLIPTAASNPLGYARASEKYTESSAEVVFSSQTPGLFVPTIVYRSEIADYAAVVAGATAGSNADHVRTVKTFSWNGRDGVVMGDFPDAVTEDPVSVWLYYNDSEGRMVTITARSFSAGELVSFLKTLERAP